LKVCATGVTGCELNANITTAMPTTTAMPLATMILRDVWEFILRYSVGLASAWGLPGRRGRSARACQLAHAVRGRSTQQTVAQEDQSYASKSWLVGSLAHLVAPIVKRWAGRLTTGMTRKVRRRTCTATSAASASLVVDDTHSLIAYGLTRLSHGCSLHQ